MGARDERLELQLLAVEVGDVVEAGEVERAGELEDLVAGDVELAHEQLEHGGADGLLDLEPDGRAEAAAQQLLLERSEEVLGVVLLDLDVLVAGDAEAVDLEHLHAGEEPAQVLADDVLERHEPLVADVDEAVERRRHLHAREVLLARLGVAHQHGEVEREPGDVGEGVGRVDGERRQDREDPLLEELLAGLLLLLVEVVPAQELDAVVEQRRHDLVAEQRGVAGGQLTGLGPDRLEHLARHQPRRGPYGDARGDASLEAGDADHEELVEVAGEDREEPRPLQQRHPRVLGQLEHPLVEVEPGDLAVEEPVVVLRDGLEHLRVRDVRRRTGRALDHQQLVGVFGVEGAHAVHDVTDR